MKDGCVAGVYIWTVVLHLQDDLDTCAYGYTCHVASTLTCSPGSHTVITSYAPWPLDVPALKQVSLVSLQPEHLRRTTCMLINSCTVPQML